MTPSPALRAAVLASLLVLAAPARAEVPIARLRYSSELGVGADLGYPLVFPSSESSKLATELRFRLEADWRYYGAAIGVGRRFGEDHLPRAVVDLEVKGFRRWGTPFTWTTVFVGPELHTSALYVAGAFCGLYLSPAHEQIATCGFAVGSD